jgi:NAD(P)-dependent dehydrogenase (short-subunit alcohol dehydrogenase family)
MDLKIKGKKAVVLAGSKGLGLATATKNCRRGV